MASTVMRSHRFDLEEFEAAQAAAEQRGETLSAALQRAVREYPEWVASRCRRSSKCLLERGHQGRCVTP